MHVVTVQLSGVAIRGLRPEVVTEGDEVLVHYRSRTNVKRRLSTKTLARVGRRTREHLEWFRGLVRTRADYAYSGSEGEATLRTCTAPGRVHDARTK